MIQNHEDLKKSRGNIIENERYIQSLEEQFESEKQKNARIQDKVNSIREKQSLHDRVNFFSSVLRPRAWFHFKLFKDRILENFISRLREN